MVGSLGTLAILTQLTFKLKPIPQTSAMLMSCFEDYDELDIVLERLLTSETRPVVMEVLNSKAARSIDQHLQSHSPPQSLRLPTENHPLLLLKLEGTEQDVNWQSEQLQSELNQFGPVEMQLWNKEAEQSVSSAMIAFPTWKSPLVFQASLRPSATLEFSEIATRNEISLISHAGNGIVLGHLPQQCSALKESKELLASLQEFVDAEGGTLKILSCDSAWKESLPVWGASKNSWRLMQKLKEQLDPHNRLNPGRFRFADS